MEDFATYILNEKDYIQKMVITYYLSEKTGIFFDKSIVLRTQIAKMFMNYAKIDLDQNLVLTAVLLCNCKKIDNAQKIGKLETYAKEGAEYLSTLGFNKRFCKICEQLNRYSESEPREPESDLLEIIDQFTGLILRRDERDAFLPEEAIVILKERNLKNVNNRYLEDFITFVKDMENVMIKETIEVPVFRKLVKLYYDKETVKSYIAAIGNKYGPEIDRLIAKKEVKDAKEMLTDASHKEKETSGKMQNYKNSTKKTTRKTTRYVRVFPEVAHSVETARNVVEDATERGLFSKEIAERIMNHESMYKIVDDEPKEG